MTLDYACFVSYRNTQTELTESFITQLCDGLQEEIAQYVGTPLYVDKERLKPGTLYNPALAQALCRSACLLMIYTPRYFDLADSYCAREYKAMEELEAARLPRLTQGEHPVNGLIIPVIFRGMETFPEELSGNRQYHKFDDFSLAGEEMKRHSGYVPSLKEIAKYIAERCRELEANADLFTDCDTYQMPTHDAIKDWLAAMAPPAAPFPSL